MLATTIQYSNTTPHHQDGGTPLAKNSRVLSQGPIVCLAIHLLPCTQPPSTTDENPSRLTPHQLEGFSWCSLERRGSSRTFRYGYLVTTSSQSPIPPSTAPSQGLGHWLRVLPTFMT